MDPKKFGMIAGLDTRYLERRNVRGRVGFAWNNRHAKKHGMKAEWLGYDPITAAQRADVLNKRYDKARAGKEEVYAEGTLGRWLAKIEKTAEHNERSDKVRNEVENAFGRLRTTPLINAQMGAITGRHVKKMAKKLATAIGVSLTHRTCKWLRFAFSQAKEDGLITANPMTGLRIKRPPARQVVVWEDEVERLITHFKKTGRPSLALAVRFAFDTSQRESDIIKFPRSRYQDGDVIIRQAKTGATVRMPALPELRTAIAEAKQQDTIQIIISETTGRPYKSDNFSHLINQGFRDLKLVDDVTGKQKVFQDLRRSAIVRLALAGCTIPMIASISGHSYARCEQILETYLPRSSEMAKLAIERLLMSRAK